MPSRRSWTLIFPYYDNPTMLARQLEWLGEFPPGDRELLELIVCDDGSPRAPALPVFEAAGTLGFEAQLFRIKVDVRWNWLACRNLAMRHASHHWRLMTDIDHLVPLETARRITDVKLRERYIYRFRRKDWPALTPYKEHPNSWLMTEQMWKRVGGYDERFSGFYGTDGMFRDRCREAAHDIIMLEEPLLRVPREAIPDASTTTYGRKEEQDRAGVQRIRQEIAASGDLEPKQGLFPWERLL